jgi:hypothetical protein
MMFIVRRAKATLYIDPAGTIRIASTQSPRQLLGKTEAEGLGESDQSPLFGFIFTPTLGGLDGNGPQANG